MRRFPPLPSSASASASAPPLPRSSPQSYLRSLDACLPDKNLLLGSQIHSHIIISGLQTDSFLAAKLIALYSLCSRLPIAENLFARAPDRNVFLLNAMIRGYSANGSNRGAIDVFRRTRLRGGVEPDSYTFSCTLKACSAVSDLSLGRELHGLVHQSGLGADVFVSNSLVCMYAKCGSLQDAVKVFDGMSHRDTVSWNSVVQAYALNGFGFKAAEVIRDMVASGLKPDQVTIVGIASSYSSAEAVVRELHGYVLRYGYESISVIQNALVSAYGKCGRTEVARSIFDGSTRKDRVTWNALISCYAQNRLVEESTQLLRDMEISGVDADVITYSGLISSLSQNDMFEGAVAVFKELLSLGLKPDAVAIASVLPAVSDSHCCDSCKEIHGYSYRHELESDRRVRNALVSVYSKCGSVPYAEQVFEAIESRDVISWSSMVAGHAQNRYFVEALDTFRQMISAGMKPNPITITGVLTACSGVSGLTLGKEVHLWAIKNSFEGQSFVGSALVDMYAKCGRIKDSRRVFDLMHDRNLVTWNSMIGGYAVHGLGEDALEVFRMMKEPDQVSFITVLSACSHGGLVEEGIEIFNSMKYTKLSLREGHYACMVDLLGRSGRLSQALDLVRSMPMKPSNEIWGALLGACKIHSNLEIGMYTGERIVESGSSNSGYYVMLSNMLANSGRWQSVEVTRKLMKERGVKKTVGCSWIEVDKGVHAFVAKERTKHPEWLSLFRVLSALNEQIRGMSC